jgi:Putative metallopeptidase
MIFAFSSFRAVRLTSFPVLLCAMLFGAPSAMQSAWAQTDAPNAQQVQRHSATFRSGIDETVRALANEPRFRGVSERERRARIEFVVGNIIFVMAHELGHALISEMELPVLGREEDAADDFAIIKALTLIGTDFSRSVLVEAAKGWFWAAQRDSRDGEKPTYYQRHGLNEQRAYQIVCMMVGSDPERFKELADRAQLPEDRRRTCGWDYETASTSWRKVIAPHARHPDWPRTPIEVVYGDATGELTNYARSFRDMRFLETFAQYASDSYRWPAPLKMEMRTCGEPGARWTIPTRTLHICYEMIQEFADLYSEYGSGQRVARRRTRPRNDPYAAIGAFRLEERGTRSFRTDPPRRKQRRR